MMIITTRLQLVSTGRLTDRLAQVWGFCNPSKTLGKLSHGADLQDKVISNVLVPVCCQGWQELM